MKTKLTQTLIPRQTMNTKQIQSLAILTMNQHELDTLIQEVAQENPLLEIHPNFYHQSFELMDDLITSTNQITLVDELFSQINTSKYKNKKCARAIVTHLDSNGYCSTPLNELKKSTHFKQQELKDALEFIQTLHPRGIGAKDLTECLLLQCKTIKTKNTDILLLSIRYLDDLAKGHFLKVAKALNTTEEVIKECLMSIQTCNPRPASNYSLGLPTLIPELVITNSDGVLSIQTKDYTRYLTLNNEFDHIQDKETRKYLKKQAKLVLQLLTSIEKRSQTLHAISSILLEIQKDYILYNKPLHPLTYKQVADIFDCTPSTVFRSIQNKSLQYEGRFILLSSLFANECKDGYSSNYVKSLIDELIDNENNNYPLSDEKIRIALLEKNINISRRTIMKYRSQLRIPNSIRRKINL